MRPSLGNAAFVGKAPEKVVAEIRERSAKADADVGRLAERLRQLRGETSVTDRPAGDPKDPDEVRDPADELDEIAWDAGNLGLPAEEAGLAEDDPTGEIAAATADLDDDVPPGTSIIVPDAPPLTLGMVESVLDRRRSEVQISPTLSRITALLDLLGNPQQAYPVIQIAGTNGKTSTARMIDALLDRTGLRAGRFTSPHLQSVTERISG